MSEPGHPPGLGPISVRPMAGAEQFRDHGHKLGFDVLGFWQWSTSDLVSNATRGVLAEYLVAQALGIAGGGVRDEWAECDLECDLEAANGIRIEVKSAAYIQSWRQERLSGISFRVPKTRGWNRETNRQDDTPRRKADVYVFAVLAHQEQATLDPLDVSQWRFYVVPTYKLDERRRSQHSVTLPSLRKLVGEGVPFASLRATVEQAAAQQLGRDLGGQEDTDPPAGSSGV